MPTRQPATSSSRGDGAERVRLRPTGSSVVGTGCVGLGCLAFGAVFAVAGVGALVASGSLVAIVFILAGLFVVAIGGRQVLAAVGPRPHLWADRTKIEVGETFNLRWETSSRFRQASSIRITREGRELAIERAYNPVSHTSVFMNRVITSAIGPLAGTSSVTVPQHTMPSFRAKTAFIEWHLRAEVQTHMWPNVEESYTIVVVPSRVEPK